METAFLTIDAVFDAYFDCRRAKRNTINQLKFEADLEEKVGWLSCPTYVGERKFYKDEHSSYSVPLAETGYQEGDEAKAHRVLKEPRENGRLHHDRINMTAPPKAKEGDFKFSSADERKRRS